MNKKGMTLVELITVLVVIGMIAVITIPTIIKTINKSKEENIKESANKYISKNVGLNIFIDDSTITEEITLETLVNEGYLKGELKNLKTNKEYDLVNSKVTIKKENNSYIYTIDLVTK